MVRQFRLISRSVTLFLSLLFLISCSTSHRTSTEKYLDRPFSSLCEAFETVARFALNLHVERTPAEFEKFRTQTVEKLAETWDVSPSSASTTKCEDLENLAAARKERVEPQALYQNALGTFVALLDPHSSYLSPEAMAEWEREQRNEGHGIGVALRFRVVDRWLPLQSLVVEEVFPNSPASGLLEAGDRIVSVGETPVAGMLFKDVRALLEQGDSVTLGVQEHDQPVIVPRGPYKSSPVFVQRISSKGGSIGYFKVREFTNNTAQIFMKALEEFERNADTIGYAIDLRNCPGGQTVEATKFVDALVDRGVVFGTRGKSASFPDELNPNGISQATEKGEVTDRPIVVLVDPGTASAAEIVAGALKESGRALIVGERSFGKGTGQRILRLGEKNGLGGQIHLTMFRYYLFDGFTPQAKGVSPHILTPDPLLADAVARRQQEGKKTILFEEDYGAGVVSPIAGSAPSTPTALIQQVLDEIQRRDEANEYRDVCPEGTEDCQKERTLAFLQAAFDVEPEWPSVRLDVPGQTALDRSGEATYPSRHGRQRTSKVAGKTKTPLLLR